MITDKQVTKSIVIEKISNDLAEYLVFCPLVESPFSQLAKIAKRIKSKECYVLFDLLCQVGDRDNRFVVMKFKDKAFIPDSAKIIGNKGIDNSIRKFVSDCLRENEKVLEYCILFSNQKEQIRNGGIV